MDCFYNEEGKTIITFSGGERVLRKPLVHTANPHHLLLGTRRILLRILP